MLPFHKMQPPVLEASCLEPLLPCSLLPDRPHYPGKEGGPGLLSHCVDTFKPFIMQLPLKR